MRELLKFLSRRFGIPETLRESLVLTRRGKEAWVSTPEASEINGPILRGGIRLARATPGDWKLTAEGAMVIGKTATRCVLDLEEHEALSFMSGQNLSGDFPWPDGQVIVRWKGFPVGVGLLRGHIVKNQLRLSRRLPPRKR